eukprot:CAMPEP_0117558960 /NCGR_PEP_ID=MMETSP0784-20121206/53113_1 /TAXON_ID=39447 /ORGANISM="" /LENGTH=53 /DNA_ID=CAMNT_0005356321 /DNA_START=365 /DNA_END=526 /DNA_ORIENTATION=+
MAFSLAAHEGPFVPHSVSRHFDTVAVVEIARPLSRIEAYVPICGNPDAVCGVV